MDGSGHEVRVKTLYGVTLEAMQAGKTYGEVVSLAQARVREKGLHYIRTSIETRKGELCLVVYWCPSFADLGRADCVNTNDVAVPDTFRMQAEAWLRYQ